MASKNNKKRAEPGEIIAVIRRIASENGREYVAQYALAGICLLLTAATTAFTAWIMRDVIDKIFYERRSDLVLGISAVVFGAFALRGFASYGQAVILAKIGNNLVARYQRRVFAHMMRLGLDFFVENRSARLAARINQNVNGVRDLLNTTLTAVTRDAVSLIALLVVMVIQDPVLSLSALVIGPPLVLTVNMLVKRLRRMTREQVDITSRLLGSMQEAAQGIAVVKAFTMEDQLSRSLDKQITRVEKRSNKIASVSERLTPVTDVLAGTAVAGVIAYAGLQFSGSATPPGSVFAFITALLLAYDPARRLARVQVSLEKSLVNARMIYEILDTPPRQQDAPGAPALRVDKGEVRFENIRFGYVGDLPVLHGVSFTAEAGKTTAIVGASGAGKSTLIALLERFYDLDGGRITVDGQDISTITKQSLRSSIAYVSQQPYLFEGTIRDNIRYGRETATDGEIEEAAKLANAHEFIERQSQGYDTEVGENGVTLSGGQRQRIAIARALVRDAPILLLDEATSALDNESEARVQEALDKAMVGRTTIVIAHRLSTVVNADKIVVMEEGQVAEEGTHGTLLADERGLYARFHRLQSARGLGLVDDRKAAQPAPEPQRIATHG
ncbi:ABC transporter ATP-binding protein/permease [Mesorhizobium sp. RP14(2022)]|uniref:ABC transporter ATP-binding protein/permease n=1 Tax=Mesorhizobium liriopis TaxID=2953882 RepID=A0ABT1C3Z9_9HYPH|nr:ABC transporter ATP-binding protein [Mesorhizobium liriopis]MCO6049549.1 ABC transporter ATP-binding protein/permease [Mesorhizobium liriopis]